STIVEAYDRLAAEGIIHARPGSGFYASGVAPSMQMREPGPSPAREVDPFWVSRQALDAPEGTDRPGCGWLPPDWMPHQAISRALREIARGEPSVLTDYGNSRGTLSLRRQLARLFAEDELSVSPDAILLTGST
ncbi:PLP-dependent aminotransferase family protein, partial [Glutamicibacter soli]